MYRFAILAILSVASFVDATNRCPTDVAFNQHCTCYRSSFTFGDHLLSVTCSALHDDVIGSVLSNLKGREVKYIKFDKNPFTELNKEDVQGLQVRNIIFQNSELETVEYGALGSIKSLETATFHKTKISAIPDISNATSLQKLAIDSHKIKEIGAEDFPEDNNLAVLDIENGNLDTFADGAFLSLNHLKTLVLSNNLISKLPSVLFSEKSQVKTIDLRGNHIEEVPPHLFDNSKSLGKLILRDNFIANFTVLPFKTVLERGTYVDVQGNRINCDKSLCWLTDLIGKLTTYRVQMVGNCRYRYGAITMMDLTSRGLKCSTS